MLNIARGDDGNLRTKLIRTTGGTVLLRIISLGLGLLISIMLARLLEAVQFGAYSYAFSWLKVLTIPTMMGLNILLTREIAAYHARQDWPRLWGILQFSILFSLLVSLIIIVVFFAISVLITNVRQLDYSLQFFNLFDLKIAQTTDFSLLYTLWIVLLLLPFNSITLLRGSAMKGLQKVVLGQVPDLLVLPLLFIALFGGAYIVLDYQVSSVVAMSVRLVATLIVFVYGLYILRRALSKSTRQMKPEYELHAWLRSTLPLLGMGLVNIAHERLDVLMLGPLAGLDQVAFYTIALTLSGLVSLPLSSGLSALSPTFSAAYATGKTAMIQNLVTRSTRMMALGSIPIVLALVLLGDTVLSIYGVDYRIAYPSILILIIGQLVSVVAGPVGTLLIMSGHEKIELANQIVSTLLYFTLNLLLIPNWGMIGAAVATTLSMVFWNVTLAWIVWRRLGITSFMIGSVKP